MGLVTLNPEHDRDVIEAMDVALVEDGRVTDLPTDATAEGSHPAHLLAIVADLIRKREQAVGAHA